MNAVILLIPEMRSRCATSLLLPLCRLSGRKSRYMSKQKAAKSLDKTFCEDISKQDFRVYWKTRVSHLIGLTTLPTHTTRLRSISIKLCLFISSEVNKNILNLSSLLEVLLYFLLLDYSQPLNWTKKDILNNKHLILCDMEIQLPDIWVLLHCCSPQSESEVQWTL